MLHRLFFVIFVAVATTYPSFGQSINIPALGLGTAGLFDATEEVTRAAFDLGVKLFDTAQASEWYNEEAVANVVRENSSDVFVVTKVHPRSYSWHGMRIALQKSHNNFGGKGNIDAVLLHAPFCWHGHCTPEQEAVSWLDGWRNLEGMADVFGIPHIGVSNLDLSQLEELVLRRANRKVAILQNWMDPLHQDVTVRKFCAKHDIVYMAFSSFGTQWSHSSRFLGRNPVMTHPILLQIARERHATVAQVILGWLAAEGVVAIPRASSVNHLQENFQICSSIEEDDGRKGNMCELGGFDYYSTVDDHYYTNMILTPLELQKIRALDGTVGSPWD